MDSFIWITGIGIVDLDLIRII